MSKEDQMTNRSNRFKRTRDADVDASGGYAPTHILPGGVPSEEQLRIINENHARTPLTADQVYVFDMEISNDLMDSYYTRMDPKTTLVNYVDDFKEGRSLQNSHEAHELGIGRSFDAHLETRGTEGDTKDPKRTAVVVSDYIQRGLQLGRVHNDHVIQGIDGGTIKDGSIRFIGSGGYRCSICSGDMADMFGDCTHVPGVTYKDGNARSMAFADIVDDHASEHSLVFDGSTPRAMIDKATAMVRSGKLSDAQVRQFEANANCRIQRQTAPVRGTGRAASTSRHGGTTVDPKTLAALVGLPDTERSTLYSLAVEQLGDDLTPDFVRQVGSALKERTNIVVDSAAIDSCMSSMDKGKKHHDDARGALQMLVTLAPAAAPEDEPAGAPEGADDAARGVKARSSEEVEKTLSGLRLLLDQLGEAPAEEAPEAAEARSVTRSNIQRTLRKPEFAGVDDLLRSAENGRKYRTSLVRDVHAWAVRAQGTSYDRGLIDTLTQHANAEQLEIFAGQMREQAKLRFAHVRPDDIPEDLRNALGVMVGSVGRQTESSDPATQLGTEGGARMTPEKIDASRFKTPAPGR